MSLPNLFLHDQRTKVIYFGPEGQVMHLSGFGAGKEGYRLGVEPSELYFVDMELLWLEGARQDGASYQDTVLAKREVDFEVQIAGDTARQFSARNNHWWESWSTSAPGTLAIFSRYTGWRWIKVRLAGDIQAKWGKDPILIRACDFDMTVAADDPLYRSFREKALWKNTNGTGKGVLQIPNPGDHSGYPEYTMPGPGTYSIQDGPDGEMLELPPVPAGRTMYVNTHPQKLTIRTYDSVTGLDERLAWKGMKTKRFRKYLKPRSMNKISVKVEGGNANSQVFCSLVPRFYRPF